MKKLTVFTPTYNRKHLLERVYLSLKSQTNKNFIWLIVDDGSTDDTRKYVDELKKEKVIEIEYLYQNNLGKMQAHNTGVMNCKTEYFVCLDSDDLLQNNAVEIILNYFNKSTKDDCAGIVAYKCISKNKQDLLGVFPTITYSTLSGLYDKGFKGETTIIFKTKILKKYLFPKYNNEKFITEVFIYDQIDRDYVYFILPEILTIYEYQENGLTNSIYKLISNNPIGYKEYWNQKFIYCYQDKEMKKMVLSCINLVCFSLNAKSYKIGVSDKMQYLVIILIYPLGFLKFLYITKKRKGI